MILYSKLGEQIEIYFEYELKNIHPLVLLNHALNKKFFKGNEIRHEIFDCGHNQLNCYVSLVLAPNFENSIKLEFRYNNQKK
jgi:hypothetical protein